MEGEPADFPPLVTPWPLRERADAFATAIAAARVEGEGRRGAGALHFVGRFELIEFAITLEPAEPLRIARKIVFAGMNALADALATLSPPEKPISFRFPGELRFDGARIGGGRLAAPEACGEDEVPDWLVFAAMVRAGGVREQGIDLAPEITTLDDEGFARWSPASFAARFARHFLVEVDSWGESGMAEIGPRYLARLEGATGAARRGIDANGDLLVRREGIAGSVRVDFRANLVSAAWYDPAANEPRG